jgi:predicted dehydrogenase
MSIIKFAVIGLGHIGKRHADIILNNKDAQLIAIIEPNLKIDLSKYQVPFFRSLTDFFDSNIETDIICIATPNYLHCQQAIQCMQNGIDVIIEKPMGLTVNECNLVDETAKNLKSNTILLDNYNRQIIEMLSKGIKTKTIQEQLHLSKSAIDKRKVAIKSYLGIDKGNDEDLLREARKRGFI